MYILKQIIVISFFLFLSFQGGVANAQENEKFVIVLDAGHGGHDPGKHSKNGYKEKEVALKIALLVGAQLEKNSDIKIIYTRKTDVFVKLRKRASIANKADADLFVSIHCNAHHTQASGTETFVVGEGNTERNLNIAKEENEVIFLEENYEENYEGFDPNSPESLLGLTLMQEEYVEQSLLLASLIQNNFTKNLKRKNRGVKQASLWVMHNTYMPSVLIETGFITNKYEGKYLVSSKGQSELSTAISGAILKYKDKLYKVDNAIVHVEKPKNEAVNNIILKNVIFKVQLAASSKKLALKSYNFKGMKSLSKVKQGKLYKYFSGNTGSYKTAKEITKKAKSSGYPDAYIVAYKNDIRVPLSEVVN